jgi:hypothetical protein
MSRLQGASSRKVILCRDGCRRRRKQAARAQARLSKTERGGRIASSARRRGSRAQLYELARARLSQSDPATGGALSLADQHLLERLPGARWMARDLAASARPRNIRVRRGHGPVTGTSEPRCIPRRHHWALTIFSLFLRESC